MLLLSLICIASALNCASMVDGVVYSKTDAFGCIYEIYLDTSDAVSIQGDLQDLIGMYAYLDILKAPLSDNQYYSVNANLDNELALLNTSTKPIYDFYREVDDIMRLAKDPNLKFQFSSSKRRNFYFDSFKAILPFKFIVEGDGIIKTQTVEQTGYEIPQELIDNNKQEVKLINDQNPLVYLRQLAQKLVSLKSANTAFTYMLQNHYKIGLGIVPLKQEELEDIKIEYTNGVIVNVEYKLLYTEVKGLRNDKKIKGDTSVFKYISNDGSVKCGTFNSSDKAINVIVIDKFYYDLTSKESTYIQTLNKCFEMIDENTYPIQIILPMNEGGDEDIEGSIRHLLSPHYDNYFYASARVNENTEKILKLDIAEHMYDPETCEVRRVNSGDNVIVNLKKPLGPFYAKPTIDIFNEEINHTRSQISIMKSNNVLFFTKLTNKRRPDQIVVFTDGYCRGTCSFFAKNLRDSGSAIIAGFGGDPEVTAEDFEIGVATSILMSSGYALSSSSFDLTKEGSQMTVSFVEMYPANYSFSSIVPREFIKTSVNERVKLYEYNDDSIMDFVKEGLRLVSKYSIDCDVTSPMVLENPTCDSKIDIEHAHGGHPCVEGRWYTLRCVPSFCDGGYKFDRDTNQCIIDACYVPTNDTSSSASSSQEIPIEESSSSFELQSSSSQEPQTDSMVYVIIGCACGFAGFVLVAAIGAIVAVLLINRRNQPNYVTLE